MVPYKGIVAQLSYPTPGTEEVRLEATRRAAQRRSKKAVFTEKVSEHAQKVVEKAEEVGITEAELRSSHEKIRNHFATRFKEVPCDMRRHRTPIGSGTHRRCSSSSSPSLAVHAVSPRVASHAARMRMRVTTRPAVCTCTCCGGQVRRGFRLLDEDSSGTLTHNELRSVLTMFNLAIKPHVLQKIIELADWNGDGAIDYAEARPARARTRPHTPAHARTPASCAPHAPASRSTSAKLGRNPPHASPTHPKPPLPPPPDARRSSRAS